MNSSNPARAGRTFRRRAAWVSPVLICAALAAAALPARAQSVAMTGSMGSKALLVVDGGSPKAVAAGETWKGVKVISVNGGEAVVEIGGKRLTVVLGGAPVASKGGGGGQRIVLPVGDGGHYYTEGSINGGSVRFLVDTGATMVSMGVSDAQRIGLNYKNGTPVYLSTANGTAQGWKVTLASVRVQDVELTGVEAVVAPQSMGGMVLLGNSFLSRFTLKREGDTLTLDRRF